MTRLILKQLMTSEEYASKVYPFLKSRYFDNSDEAYLFKVISKYQQKYSTFPSIQEVDVLISKNQDAEDRLRLEKLLLKVKDETSLETGKFILDETEEFIRNKDLQLSILDSVEIIQKGDKTDKAGIPSLIESSLAISFDKTIGINYSENAADRLEYYKNTKKSGFRCDLDIFNRLTNGGFKRKTLTTIVAQPFLGKSLLMTHLATSFILKGYNVLYITLEMAEEEIAKRIDSNLLNIEINELEKTSSADFLEAIKSISSAGIGNLFIKEFPTGGANGIHFKALLKELAQKQKFKPDIIFIDYLGIMGAVSDNMYENIKKNAESLRALSIEYDAAVITASQTNRSGFDKTNGIGMTDIAESTGPLQISDLVLGLSKFDTGNSDHDTEKTDNMKRLMSRQILINVIKNRMGGVSMDKFLLRQNFRYMRIEDDEDEDFSTAQAYEEKANAISAAAKDALNFNF